MSEQRQFDLNDGRWTGLYWHNDNDNGFSGNFDSIYDWEGIHPDWWGEMERLARKHGGLSFGDEGCGTFIRHEDCKKPFVVYWIVCTPRRKPSLFDLLMNPANKGGRLA